MTSQEVIEFEEFTNKELLDYIKKMGTTELVKDTKSYDHQEDSLTGEMLLLIESHFGGNLIEEWKNSYPNFKEKYDGLKKLARSQEKEFKRRIATIIMTKYTNSAIEHYQSLKNINFQLHLCNKNIIDFLSEA